METKRNKISMEATRSFQPRKKSKLSQAVENQYFSNSDTLKSALNPHDPLEPEDEECQDLENNDSDESANQLGTNILNDLYGQETFLSKDTDSYNLFSLVPKSEEELERELEDTIRLINRGYKNSSYDECMSFLCSFFKMNILTPDKEKPLLLQKTPNNGGEYDNLGGRSWSIDNLSKLDIKTVVDNVIKNNKENPSCNFNCIIKDNIEIVDEKIKIMMVGKSKTYKSLFIHLLRGESIRGYEYKGNSK